MHTPRPSPGRESPALHAWGPLPAPTAPRRRRGPGLPMSHTKPLPSSVSPLGAPERPGPKGPDGGGFCGEGRRRRQTAGASPRDPFRTPSRPTGESLPPGARQGVHVLGAGRLEAACGSGAPRGPPATVRRCGVCCRGRTSRSGDGGLVPAGMWVTPGAPAQGLKIWFIAHVSGQRSAWSRSTGLEPSPRVQPQGEPCRGRLGGCGLRAPRPPGAQHGAGLGAAWFPSPRGLTQSIEEAAEQTGCPALLPRLRAC